VRSAKCEGRGARGGVRGAKCEVRSARCEVRGAKCEGLWHKLVDMGIRFFVIGLLVCVQIKIDGK
jgi:hypothetical protein